MSKKVRCSQSQDDQEGQDGKSVAKALEVIGHLVYNIVLSVTVAAHGRERMRRGKEGCVRVE